MTDPLEITEITTTKLAEMEESLNWHAAIVAVLLEEAGGAVEVSADEIAAIDLYTARITIVFNEEKNTYLIERATNES